MYVRLNFFVVPLLVCRVISLLMVLILVRVVMRVLVVDCVFIIPDLLLRSSEIVRVSAWCGTWASVRRKPHAPLYQSVLLNVKYSLVRSEVGDRMVKLPDWEKIVVPQRHDTGCLPTGYEWMIRYLGITGIKLHTFQEDFDLQYREEGMNNFQDVTRKVKATYPNLNVYFKEFATGKEKVEFIKQLVEASTPCVLSIALRPEGGFWHIVPVVSIDNEKIKVIWSDKSSSPYTKEYTIKEIIYVHDNWSGGRDIAWITK